MRVIALFIDNIVLATFVLSIYFSIAYLVGEDFSIVAYLVSEDSPSVAYLIGVISRFLYWTALSFLSDNDLSGVAGIVIRILAFLYSPILISIWGTTIGKRALGLYVVRSNGARCGFWRALARQLAQILSTITLIGYLMVAFREDKRALHDLIADTVVVHRY